PAVPLARVYGRAPRPRSLRSSAAPLSREAGGGVASPRTQRDSASASARDCERGDIGPLAAAALPQGQHLVGRVTVAVEAGRTDRPAVVDGGNVGPDRLAEGGWARRQLAAVGLDGPLDRLDDDVHGVVGVGRGGA